MFYTFNQNNSGGGYARNPNVDEYVIVEADSVEDACSRAEAIGVYFNGCEDDIDCPCCGDRWYPPYDTGADVPSYYNSPLTLANIATVKNSGVHNVVIHYRDHSRRYTTTACGNDKLNKLSNSLSLYDRDDTDA